MKELTQKRLKKLLHYDKGSGVFTWLVDGQIAGHDGVCINIRLFGKNYRAHRLAFLYVNGKMPTFNVRHINGYTYDNGWCNLVELTPDEKARREAEEDNTIVEGVSRHFPHGKNAGLRMWKAAIIINGKSSNLGYFHKKESAIKAKKEAEQRYCPYLLTRMQ